MPSFEPRYRTSSRRCELALRCAVIAAAALMVSCSRNEPEAVPPKPAAPAVVENDDAVFPRRLEGDAGSVVVHAPQIDQWIDHRKVHARLALEVTPKGQPTLYGTGHLSAATDTDLDARTVTLHDLVAERFVFTAGTSAVQEQAGELVRLLMRKQPQRVPLDLFLVYLQGEAAQQHAAALNMQPPPIFVAYSPAILVITNGKPVWAPIKESSLKFAVNTNWDLFQAGTRWYLRNQEQWLSTYQLYGIWNITTELPPEFSHLPDDDNWKETRSHIPPSSSRPPPQVLFSERPAELIQIDGKPLFEPMGQSGVAYLSNTSSDVFLLDGNYYYLASGRWFIAPALDGKWRAAMPLPPAFASIPSKHAKARVRASVPGTEEAQRAVEEAAIPRTAVVNRSAVPAVIPTYDGAPKFTAIPGTNLSRASNSGYDVITDGTLYYFCYDAVWYLSSTPSGPWSLATTVPSAIYSIPASSPAYHLTQVKIYETTPTTVTYGYTSGYYGAYSTGTTVVFGTGYMYPPYIGYYDYYPVYYYYPYSYGYGSYYNPNTGAFGRTAVAYGPYGGAGRSASYNPSTGTYRRGYAAWDDDEIAGTARAYNPRTGTGAATRGYATEDEGWKQTAIVRGDEWAYAERERDGDTARTEIATSRGGSGTVTTKRDGDTVKREYDFSYDGKSINSSGERSGGEYSGSFSTSGGASGTVERKLDDGELSREMQVNRDGRSTEIDATTRRTANGLETDFETSGGASGTVNREVDNGTVHRSGEFTRGDQSASTDVLRGSEGTVGRIESGGETVGVGRTEGGDLYAAKDGEVYRRTDDGWQQHDGNDWNAREPRAEPTNTAREGTLNDLDTQRAARERGFEQYGASRRERMGAGGGHRARGGRRR
jgi:hypothetical protein